MFSPNANEELINALIDIAMRPPAAGMTWRCVHCHTEINDETADRQVPDLCQSCAEKARNVGAELLVSLHATQRAVNFPRAAKATAAGIAWVRVGVFDDWAEVSKP